MLDLLIIAGIISLLAAFIGTLIALKIQSSVLRRTGIEHAAWQHSQEAHQNLWEVKQRKNALEFEQKLTQQVQQIQVAWQKWEAHDQERLAKLTLEQKLAHIPRVEDIPVPPNGSRQEEQVNPYGPYTQPPSFYKTDLSGQDLSYRYLGYADLRETQLAGTNLYMADLTGACLTGANLTDANLAGANLTRTDLRGAILAGANMLVADLHDTVLIGANLLGVHNLTLPQLNSAIYNDLTLIDEAFDLTLPYIPGIHPTQPKITITLESVDHSPTSNANSMAPSGPSTEALDSAMPADLSLLIQRSLESPILLPQASYDGQHDQMATHLLLNTPENSHTEEFDTAIPSSKYNGKGQV